MQSQSLAVPFPPASHVAMVGPVRLLSLARRVLDVIRQRRQLATLSNRQLADIGITREQAVAEAARPFWDLPRKQADTGT